jgi:adenylate cyclase class IV
MPRNVEIKARVKDLEEVKKIAASLSGSEGETINQRDVFFKVNSGSFKCFTFLKVNSDKFLFSLPN